MQLDEVGDVLGHDRAPLSGRPGQEVRIGQSVEVRELALRR